MTILLAALGVALFAAFCVWLGVRVINRRERWANWTLAAVVGVPVLYVASFGPACWISSQANREFNSLSILYRPLLQLMSQEHLRQIRETRTDCDSAPTYVCPLQNGLLFRYAGVLARKNACWQYTVKAKLHPGKSVVIEKEEWRWGWL